MSTLGLVASALQVADIGIRLSCKIVSLGVAVGNTKHFITLISKDLSHTSSILRELGQSLELDRSRGSCSENLYATVAVIVKDCRDLFQEMDEALTTRLSRFESNNAAASTMTDSFDAFNRSFLQPKMELLDADLERLKSTLLLVLNVTIYTKLVNER